MGEKPDTGRALTGKSVRSNKDEEDLGEGLKTSVVA